MVKLRNLDSTEADRKLGCSAAGWVQIKEMGVNSVMHSSST